MAYVHNLYVHIYCILYFVQMLGYLYCSQENQIAKKDALEAEVKSIYGAELDHRSSEERGKKVGDNF